MLKKYIGDKKFYKMVLSLAIPILVQNAITNFVNVLDNIMVGSVGTNAFSGVGISNQLIFVYTFLIFGVSAAASIFGAQFFGKGDTDGVRYSFRFKIIVGVLITSAVIAILYFFGTWLINLYLLGDTNTPKDVAEIIASAKGYLNIMLIGLIPFAISQGYGGTLRECNRSILPMVAGVVAVAVNLIFNYLLIFGKFGFPKLSVNGAAIATVISRFVEMFILIIATRISAKRSPFILGAFRSIKIPLKLLYEMLKKGIPLIFNEVMWAGSIAVMNQCYSSRGIDSVAANNITQTYFNVFAAAFTAVGISIGIILGQQLGKGEEKTIKDTCRKLIAFSFIISVIFSAIFFLCAYAIPQMYNTNDNARYIARVMMQICAVFMPLEAIAQAFYFTLRSGGKTFLLFLFDVVFSWAVNVLLAFIIANFTDIPILWMYAICQSTYLIKCVFGYVMVKRGSWIRNIVSDI